MRSKACTALTAPLVLHRTRLDKCAMKKFGISDQLRNKLFWFSKPLWMLCAFVKCAMVLAKRPQFLLFLNSKGGTKTIAHLSIAEGWRFWSLDRRLRNEKKKHLIQVRNEYSPQLSKLLYNCKLKNKKRSNTLKGSQRMGVGRIFLKTFCASHCNEDLSNEPNFDRIHLSGQYL